jgi:hypothetical protein
MTDLDRMILAARQIGEVVGEDLLDNIGLDNKGRAWMDLEDTTSGGWCPVFLTHADALDLLTARVWRAVWAWSRGMKAKRITRNDLSGNVTQAEHGIGIHWKPQDVFGTGYPDLPSAVAAIHAYHMENRNA